MEGKTHSMAAKKKNIKGVIFCYSCKWKFEQRRCKISCWQSQVFFKELDLFFFPCFVPKLSQFADLVQTMAQGRVSNTADDAALVLCLRQHLSSNLGGGAFKGDKSTDPDFLVSQYENFLLKLYSLTLRPSSKQLERTVLKAHDGISVNDAREWSRKICFLTQYIRSKGRKMSSGSKTEPSVARLYECFQTGESAKVTLPVQKCVLWKGASKLSPQKKEAKTPQKEKAAVASSSKRKTTSEGASASKRQSILAAWGAETVESSQSSPEEFLEVESSQESHKDGKKTEDFAASFFDQQQCSMVVVDKKGCHHVCTTSPGEHGFLKFTFQGLEHTTEIPNLALESVQVDKNLKRPASGAKTVAKAKAASKKAAAKGKSGAKSKAEPSPADIAPDHQLEEIVSASASNVSKTYKLEHYKVTKTRKYASLGLRREFGDKKQIWSRSMRNIDTEKAMALVREAIAKLNAQKASEKEACDVLDDQIQACSI